jgi:hypothetical protein
MHLNTDSYETLYGTAADADIAAGLIGRQVDTAPRGLTATGIPEGIVLEWEPYEHPIVAGYNVYRRLAGQSYVDNPHAQVGRIGVYSDTGLVGGQVYSYTLCSYDPVGNLHQVSPEVSAVALKVETPEPSDYMPVIAKDARTGTVQGSEKWHQP